MSDPEGFDLPHTVQEMETKMKKCDTCNGKGQNRRGQRCLDCMGSGEVPDIDLNAEEIAADDDAADSDDEIVDEDESVTEDMTISDEDGVIYD